MSSNRVGPIPPDPSRSQAVTPKTQREQAQRVEKVREVDPDEQARKRDQFRMMMEDTDDDAAPRVPSPFETQFYTEETPSKTVPGAGDGAVPSPSYSPPPSLSGAPLDASASDEEQLPQAGEFWKDVGLPDSSIAKPNFTEKQTAAGKGKSIEPSPFGAPGKVPAAPKPSSKAAKGQTSKRPGAEEAGLKSAPKRVSDAEEKAAPMGRLESQAELNARGKPVGKRPAEKAAPKLADEVPKDARILPPDRSTKEFDQKQKAPSDEVALIQPPSTTPMPIDIQPVAMAAATVASPYLSPEVLPLFYQMVGSILIMTNQPTGVSRTEVVLNSPGFARSKFYGAKIEIVKYASAPDSVNIRLSGSDEAVTAFRQNIPSLMAAFQQGNFQFRVGRMEAEYVTDRPVFRRKDERRGGATGGDSMDKEKR